MKNKIVYKYFSDDDFLRISQAIAEAEKTTAGEIKISFKEKSNLFEKQKSIKDLAVKEFYKLKMNETRDKTGILLFFHLLRREFFILADEGINSKVEQDTWNNIRDEILKEFSNGNFCKAMIDCIKKVGKVLTEHFPIKPDDVNELSNKVEI